MYTALYLLDAHELASYRADVPRSATWIISRFLIVAGPPVLGTVVGWLQRGSTTAAAWSLIGAMVGNVIAIIVGGAIADGLVPGGLDPALGWTGAFFLFYGTPLAGAGWVAGRVAERALAAARSRTPGGG